MSLESYVRIMCLKWWQDSVMMSHNKESKKAVSTIQEVSVCKKQHVCRKVKTFLFVRFCFQLPDREL